MELDHEACYRALSTRDARFVTDVYRRPHDGGLLPTDLPGAYAKTGERNVLPHSERGAGGRFSPVSSVPPGEFSGPGGLARHVEHRFARLGADRRRRARWRGG